MKLLNIGCGSCYHPSWINIDLSPTSPDIKTFDIRKKLPFADSTFDAVYHSHLIEHLTPNIALDFLTEIFRVLKSGGIMRVVTPDLAEITRLYLVKLDAARNNVPYAEEDYDWVLLELFDQITRDSSGGLMRKYLSNKNIRNKSFIISRIGFEAETFWNYRINNKSMIQKIKSKSLPWYLQKLRVISAKLAVRLFLGNEGEHALEEGLFRNSGEIHRWMYDSFSLSRLIGQAGFIDINTCSADRSRISDFNTYQLDIVGNHIRKPDSLFIEGMKP